MSTQNFKSIWVPETRADAWDMALMLSNNNQRDALDLVKCHASFGHHWCYDMRQAGALQISSGYRGLCYRVC